MKKYLGIIIGGVMAFSGVAYGATVLFVPQGGTGDASITSGQVIYGSGTHPFGSTATGTLTGTTNQITVSGTPRVLNQASILSIPSLFNITQASTTMFSTLGPLFVGTTSTTTIWGNATSSFSGGLKSASGGLTITGLASCSGSNALTTGAAGDVICGAITGTPFSAAGNSILVSNAAGNAIVATSSSPLYVTTIVATGTSASVFPYASSTAQTILNLNVTQGATSTALAVTGSTTITGAFNAVGTNIIGSTTITGNLAVNGAGTSTIDAGTGFSILGTGGLAILGTGAIWNTSNSTSTFNGTGGLVLPALQITNGIWQTAAGATSTFAGGISLASLTTTGITQNNANSTSTFSGGLAIPALNLTNGIWQTAVGATSTFAGSLQALNVKITGGFTQSLSSATSSFAGGLSTLALTTAGFTQSLGTATSTFTGGLVANGSISTNFINSTGAIAVSSTTPFATLAINPSAGIYSNQFAVGSSSATNFIINNNGFTGLGTTSPFARFTVSGGAIFNQEYAWGYGGNTATSSSMTVNFASSTQQLVQIGLGAITINLNNPIAGITQRIIVCNPNGTAGALTWANLSSYKLIWNGNTATAPTQTTTANHCDIYSFIVTQATSTAATGGVIYGAQNPN